jgi:hypothetical protein
MKKLLIILLFLATTYYVKAGGNDNANGTSTGTAWGHCPGLTGWTGTATLAAGDNVLFNRGDSWYGTLTISQSGTSGHPITFGAYGSGVKPIITGFTTITGWSNNGGGIYSKSVSVASAPLNMVTVNGVNTGKGRYPKEGNWLTNTTVGTGYITDNSLPSSPNWTGAQIFFKTEGYRWNHGTITSQTTHQINYTRQSTTWAGDDGYAGWGYFIDNDLRTLSTVNGVVPQLGEWFHNGTTFYMYFGGVDPNTKTVQVATLDYGIICAQSYITIDNISVIGFNGDRTSYTNGTLYLMGSNYVSVTNCEIGFIGASAILVGNYLTIDNCWIHDTNGTAILGASNYFTLTNNTIENIGLIYSSMGGWCARGCAMDYGSGTHILVQYNTYRNVGSFCAKTNGADNVTISNNYFYNCVCRAFDAGCIYMNGLSSNRVISNNICVNTSGSMEGTNGTWDACGPPCYSTAEAIYIDNPAIGVTITGNTCAGTIHGSGIKFGNASGVVTTNNTLYNNYFGYEIGSSNAMTNGQYYPIRNLQFTNNKIIAGLADGNSIQFMIFGISSFDDIALWGLATSSGNIYARPLAVSTVDKDFYYNSGLSHDWAWRTHAWWASATGDNNSTFSSVSTSSVNNIHFIYNATKTNKTFTLSQSMVDIANVSYSGTITVTPYTSKVLVGAG